MESTIANSKRNVIPGFREFKDTLRLGELGKAAPQIIGNQDNDSLIDIYKIWEKTPTISYAGEFLNGAKILSVNLYKEMDKISRYILENRESSSLLLYNLAFKHLYPSEENKEWLGDDFISSDAINEKNYKDPHIEKIFILKGLIKKNYKNPFLHTDLARRYMLLDNKYKSLRHMEIALKLDPDNRYIIRSASRLFYYYGDIEHSHDVLRKSLFVESDPWVLASEISFATLRNRRSKYLDKAFKLISIDRYSPFDKSELLSTLATLELNNGSLKKSKDLFNDSLISPNDNSLAQAEWVNTKEKDFIKNIDIIKYDNPLKPYEAKSYDYYLNENYLECLKMAHLWFKDAPYSQRSVLFGSYVAYEKLNDVTNAAKFCEVGLLVRPSDITILNNYAFYLAEMDQLTDAEVALNKAKLELGKSSNSEYENLSVFKVFLLATEGLINFRRGNINLGRDLYLESANLSKKLKLDEDANRAFLHMVKEEIIADTPEANTLINLVNSIDTYKKSDDLVTLKDKVINMYAEKQKKIK